MMHIWDNITVHIAVLIEKVIRWIANKKNLSQKLAKLLRLF